MREPTRRWTFSPRCEYKQYYQAKVSMKKVLKLEYKEWDHILQWKGLRLRKVEVV